MAAAVAAALLWPVDRVGAAPPGPPSTPSISDLLASAKYRAAKPKERLALLAEFREHLTSAADAG